MCMLSNSILDVTCFGCASSCRVLGLPSRPLCLDLKAIRLQVPLFFAVIGMERLGRAATVCTPAACLCIAFSGSAPIAVVVVQDFGEDQPLIGPVYWGFNLFPRRQKGVIFLYHLRVGMPTLGVGVL